MENTLKLATINEDGENSKTTILPSLDQNYFPCRICDISLPQCKTEFVYFLISAKTRDFLYISLSITPVHNRPMHLWDTYVVSMMILKY